MTAPDETVTIHSRPTDESPWSSSVSYDTLAALIDKLGEGQRLYFTCDGIQCYVLALQPKIARVWRSGAKGVVDFQGNSQRSRGRILVDELRGRREIQQGPPVVFIEASWVRPEQLVTPHPVGRMLCEECGGKGEVVLFHLPRRCMPCDGTGWMGGEVTGSSENTTETEAGETSAPGSEKGNT